jgi:2-isopropylmalate synthase
MMMTKIVDCTLREGAQAPAVSFDIDASVNIARQLIAAGIDTIECGHAAVSGFEISRIKAVVTECGSENVLTHCRAKLEDIKAAVLSGAGQVGIFLGVNDVSLQSKMPGKSREELKVLVRDVIRYAKSQGLVVRFTIEDASRTEMADILAFAATAEEAGADRICFADTVGVLEPPQVVAFMQSLRYTLTKAAVEVHFHNDRGLALANTLAAIDSGIEWVSASVNGLGERCGITDLISLLGNLHFRSQKIIRDPAILHRLSRTVAGFARRSVSLDAPIVGSFAFQHTAKLHRKAANVDASAYCWLPPEEVGCKSTSSLKCLPKSPSDWIISPKIVSSTELKYHREGPGERYVMMNCHILEDCRQYCIVRTIPYCEEPAKEHVDIHTHHVDSLFLFLGTGPYLAGLTCEVELGGETFVVTSPKSVFIPAGVPHKYRILSGSGFFINHVLAGDYNSSLLEAE